MTTPTGGFVVTENPDAGRFELHRDDELVSFATYRTHDDTVVVPHVETLWQHRGQGNADRLMAGMLDELDRTTRRIVPLCSFAASHIRDRPERHDLLA